ASAGLADAGLAVAGLASAGLAVATPAAVPVPFAAPLAAPVTPPSSGPPTAGITADGLVRRVPGANLTRSLRRSGPAQAAAGAAGATEGPSPGGPAPAIPTHDGTQSSALLSRFQSGQRAGRAAAGPVPPWPDEDHR
ncbi:MAG: hypothetical protein ACRDZN_06745, partial [Acidimicrobiales bacterium]